MINYDLLNGKESLFEMNAMTELRLQENRYRFVRFTSIAFDGIVISGE
jgi:hypothetical protein